MTLCLARRGLFAALLLAPLALPARAATDNAPAASTANAREASSVPVTALDDGILAIMHAARRHNFAERAAMLRPVVERAFDLPRILQASVGPRFAGFSAETQAELLDVFTQFTVASYVANFDDFNGERFELLSGTRAVGADEVVRTRLVPANGDPVKLDYQVHREDDGNWKIVDVLLDGSISRIAVQRSDFRALLGSGDAAPLIASLRDKVAKLAAGNIAG